MFHIMKMLNTKKRRMKDMAKEYFGEHSLRSLVQLVKAEFDKVKVETRDALSFKVDTTQLNDAIAQAIQGKVNTTDIVNNLTSEDTNKPLSAAQGKVLADRIEEKGIGDMLKSTYDKDDDGVIDKAKAAETATNATNAVNAENALRATSADTAEDATKLGGVAASEYVQTTTMTDAIATAKSEAIVDAVNEVGKKVNVANGFAGLDANGMIPSAHLPSYVDDVVEGYIHEGSFYSEEAVTRDEETGEITAVDEEGKLTGERSKIYLDLATNVQYRWSGSVYIPITSSDLVEMTADEVQSVWDSIASSVAGIGSADVVTLRIANGTDGLDEDKLDSNLTQ